MPVFVDSVKTDYGNIFADPKGVLKCREELAAKNVALFTDIHVKHAELLRNKSIEDSTKEAVKSGSDVLIITGKWTGDAPDIGELEKVRKLVKDFPILVGSGADENNIKNLFNYANGAIVSTSLKEGEVKLGEVNVKTWKQRISANKVKKLIDALK